MIVTMENTICILASLGTSTRCLQQRQSTLQTLNENECCRHGGATLYILSKDYHHLADLNLIANTNKYCTYFTSLNIFTFKKHQRKLQGSSHLWLDLKSESFSIFSFFQHEKNWNCARNNHRRSCIMFHSSWLGSLYFHNFFFSPQALSKYKLFSPEQYTTMVLLHHLHDTLWLWSYIMSGN